MNEVNMTKSVVRLVICLAILILPMLGLQPVFAKYLYPVNDYVNDFNNSLNESEEQTLKSTLHKLEQETGIELTVVTINKLSDIEPNSFVTLEDVAFKLFARDTQS